MGGSVLSAPHTVSPVFTGVDCLPAQLQDHLWLPGYPSPSVPLPLIYSISPTRSGAHGPIPHSSLPSPSLWASVLPLMSSP